MKRQKSRERREHDDRRTDKRRAHHRVSLVDPTDRRRDSRREAEKEK
jgi:hypothetical protein